jgi:hypothetical protein
MPTYYLGAADSSPVGNDANSGADAGHPWKSYSKLFYAGNGLLVPGDTVVKLDGTYTPAFNGRLNANGNTNARSGTAGAPITIMAQNERRSLTQDDGSVEPMVFSNLAYYNLTGLVVGSADNTVQTSKKYIFTMYFCSNFRVVRCVFHHANSWSEEAGLLLQTVDNCLFEECELYHFVGNGFMLFPGHYNTFRRCYANSRHLYNDSPGRGEDAFNSYPGDHNIFENCIAEHCDSLYSSESKHNAVNDRLLGCIAVGTAEGFKLRYRSDSGNTIDSMARDTEITDCISINAERQALELQVVKNTQIKRFTAFNAASLFTGYAAFEAILLAAPAIGDGLPSFFIQDSAFLSCHSYGMLVNPGYSAWTVKNCWETGGTTPFSPTIAADAGAHYTASKVQDPGYGTARIFLPAGAAGIGAGLTGGNIGATVLYQTVDGVLTATPLWINGPAGQYDIFPRGVTVPSLSDIAGTSLFDIGARLNYSVTAPVGPLVPRTRRGDARTVRQALKRRH